MDRKKSNTPMSKILEEFNKYKQALYIIFYNKEAGESMVWVDFITDLLILLNKDDKDPTLLPITMLQNIYTISENLFDIFLKECLLLMEIIYIGESYDLKQQSFSFQVNNIIQHNDCASSKNDALKKQCDKVHMAWKNILASVVENMKIKMKNIVRYKYLFVKEYKTKEISVFVDLLLKLYFLKEKDEDLQKKFLNIINKIPKFKFRF